MTPDETPGGAGGAGGADRAGGAGGDERWYEDDSTPLVRPYTVTRGRTRPSSRHSFELMDRVTAVEGAESGRTLDHARIALLELVRDESRPLAELAADADLPLTVVRVLLGDLVDAKLVRVDPPPAAAEAPDVQLLREVIHGLRML